MRTKEEITQTLKAGLGVEKCDLVLKNVKLFNVFSSEILTTNIHIDHGRIVSIDPNAILESKDEIDCNGMYAYPGLIDSHMHFESTMLSPEALANVVVPNGVTTLCADLMEIGNVAGEDGIREMLNSSKELPYHLFIEVSSRVPTAPGLETTGGIIDENGVDRLMQLDESLSLGELDPSKILNIKDEYIEKIAKTLAKRKIVNGHAIGRLGQDLNIYASSGISDDHECVEVNEMIERLRVGMKVFIREGSSERNLDTLIKGVINNKLPIENIMFCTDDKHVDDIKNEGHINYNVRRAIELGLSEIDALKMATINAAKHFRIEDEIGSITPGRIADIIISKSLIQKVPDMVFYEGKLVAKEGKMINEFNVRKYPDWIKDTVKLVKTVNADSFVVRSDRLKNTKVRIIDLVKDQIINKYMEDDLLVEDGVIKNSIEKDIIKIAVVERYGKNGNIGIGFVHGTSLKNGALAYSMSHDHHNIVVIGTNDEDMAVAVNHVAKIKGGIAVSNCSKIIGDMSLPIGGLMSEKGVDDVEKKVNELNKLAKNLGCNLKAPFMTLSFISLPTVPELGLTDFGLIDVIEHKMISLEV